MSTTNDTKHFKTSPFAAGQETSGCQNTSPGINLHMEFTSVPLDAGEELWLHQMNQNKPYGQEAAASPF